MIFNFSFAERLGYTDQMILFNTILFLIFFVLSAVLLYFQYREHVQNEKLHLQLAEYQLMKENIKNLEEFADQMRSFRHDYKNILFSLDGFISDQDLEGLQHYYQTQILPQSCQMNLLLHHTQELDRILPKEIRSILLIKIQTAFSRGIQVFFSSPQEIAGFPMESLDLVRILGIFLDNAIEAAKNLTDAVLELHFFVQADHSVLCIIRNTCAPDTRNVLSSLFEKDFTTKEGHSGLGLYHVQCILKRYPAAELYTTCKENTFTQELTLREESNRR